MEPSVEASPHSMRLLAVPMHIGKPPKHVTTSPSGASEMDMAPSALQAKHGPTVSKVWSPASSTTSYVTLTPYQQPGVDHSGVDHSGVEHFVDHSHFLESAQRYIMGCGAYVGCCP